MNINYLKIFKGKLLMKNMWMVRAGKGAFLIDEFESRNIVALGWGIGDLTNVSAEEIKRRIEEKFPNDNKYKIGIISSQIIKFRYNIKKGD